MFGLIAAGIAVIGSAIASGCAAVGACMTGIGTAVAGGISALTGALGSLATGFIKLAPTIGKILSTIGSQVCTAIKTFIAQFPKIDLKLALEIIEKAFQIIDAVMKILFPKQEMTQEEIGERAMQHPEIKREEFDSTEAYLEALKKADYKPGPPDGIDERGWKFACRCLGAGIQTRAISEKFKVATPIDFYLDCAKAGLSAKDVLNEQGGGLLEAMRAGGMTETSPFTVAMRGDAEFSKTADEMARLERALQGWKSPEMGLDLATMKERYNQ